MENKDYLDLAAFWDSNFALSEEEKEKILAELHPSDDFLSFAPSKTQANVLMGFAGKKRVLDYGCGSGWASIILAKAPVEEVIAVDVSPNSIAMTECYAKAFGVAESIEAMLIDPSWLHEQKEEGYDGFFSSNVIDVVPFEMAKGIIAESARILQSGALAVYSLNYYADPQEMEKRGCLIKGPQIYMNGVLRLTSLKDEEWEALFEKDFELLSLSYYAWPGEEKATRRLFVLKKK